MTAEQMASLLLLLADLRSQITRRDVHIAQLTERLTELEQPKGE